MSKKEVKFDWLVSKRLGPQFLDGILEYEAEVEAFLVNSSHNLQENTKHQECLEDLENLRKLIQEENRSIYRDAKRIVTAKDARGAFPHARDLINGWKAKTKNLEEKVAEYVDQFDEHDSSCGWIEQFGRCIGDTTRAATKDFMDANDKIYAARMELEELAKTHQNLHDVFSGQVLTVVEAAEQYRNKSLSKADLAAKFKRSLFTLAIERLEDYGRFGVSCL